MDVDFTDGSSGRIYDVGEELSTVVQPVSNFYKPNLIECLFMFHAHHYTWEMNLWPLKVKFTPARSSNFFLERD